MAKKVNITDKLSFEENPALIIKDKEIEVNADASTVLQIMGILGEEGTGPKQILDMFDLIFPEESKIQIQDLKLQFEDFQQVVMSAINLITGNEEDGENPGEDLTHATI